MIYKIKSDVSGITIKLVLLLFASYLLQGCENNPNDLGIKFIPPTDTTQTRYLDSQIDTMRITNSNYKKYINTSISNLMLVGNYQSYQSKALLKFTAINPDFDSSNIISAKLTLRYSNYYFKDPMGLTAFNIYRVNTNLNYSSVTFDSVNSSTFGTSSVGSFTGTPVDTQFVNITLNNQIAKDWLEYAADTNYVNKNYGVVLNPDKSSTTIKGFYSLNNINDLTPVVTIILTKNGTQDTLTLNTSEYVSLTDAPSTIIPPDRFILQSGIAYENILKFDLSKLPTNAIINNATLQFSLDNASSFITSFTTDKRIVLGMVIDSVNHKDSLLTNIFQLDSSTYSISTTTFNAVFQRWNSGNLPNLGITMKNYFELENLDEFVFYSPSASDITKRPRLKITYTLRN